MVAVPRGFVDAADVVAAILIVGGAFVVVDRIGTLARVVGTLVARFQGRGLFAIPVIAAFFAGMGALENMQEEIIPMVPVLLLLGAGLGVDAVTVVAMSAGAAMIGSAFGPTNPFQAGIAMKIAELPVGTALGPRALMLVVAFALWVAWTVRWAKKTRVEPPATVGGIDGRYAHSDRARSPHPRRRSRSSVRLRGGRDGVGLGLQRAHRGLPDRGLRRRAARRPRSRRHHHGLSRGHAGPAAGGDDGRVSRAASRSFSPTVG